MGQTFYGQMLASMRKTQSKTPYFNGGRGEQVFQGQLDQQLAENMAKANGKQFEIRKRAGGKANERQRSGPLAQRVGFRPSD